MPVGMADWAFIKRRWEEGLSAPAIEKEILQPNGKPAVTRQAILKRANKEGWKHVEPEVPAVVTEAVPAGKSGQITEPAELATAWAYEVAERLKGLGKINASADRVWQALTSYVSGGSHAMAAGLAGVSENTWQDWRESCPELPIAIAQILAARARNGLNRIETAGKRGDWKADEALLKANPLTKADWKDDKGTSSGVAIQINFGAGMPAEAMKVIEG